MLALTHLDRPGKDTQETDDTDEPRQRVTRQEWEGTVHSLSFMPFNFQIVVVPIKFYQKDKITV